MNSALSLIVVYSFPVYTKYNTIFPKAYPLSIFQKNTYELLMNVISIPSLSVLMFFLPAILKSSKYSLEFLGMSLSIILVSNILNIALKRIIHFRIRPNSTALKSINAKVLSSNRLLFNLFWRKSIIVMSLTIGFVFKIVLLSIFFTGIRNNKPQMIENMSMVFFLFISPLIIFTYAFNNIFGLLPQPISWFSRQENLLSKLFISYVFLIATPLIFDIILTFVFLFAINKLDIYFTLNYFVVTILLIINGFLGSIWRPLFIKAFFANFKSNTDMLVTFFSLITFGCVFILKGVYQIAALTGLCIAFFFYFNFIKKTINKQILAFNNPN